MKSLQKDKKRENVFIFIGGQNILSGVYESHNIYFLNNLYKYNILNNYDVVLTIIVDYKRLELKETELVNDKLKKLQKIADEYNFNLEIIYIKNRSLSSLISASKKIIKKVKCYKKKIIWSHNLFNGLLGYLLSKKIPHTYWHLDMKGVPAEEQFYKNMSLAKKILNYLVLKIIQQYITRKADSISVVSTRFKKYLAERYGYKKKIIVYPSVYKKDTFYFDKNMRDYYRSELGIKEDEKLIFYSGNLQKWQQPDFIFRFFKNIERTDRILKYHFLFLCLEVENAKFLAKTHNMDNVIITSALGKELVGIYNAADIGVICRKNDLVNNVASPTKVAEYLATKNSIVLTNSVGDYGIDLADKPYALIVNNLKEFQQITSNDLDKILPPSDVELKNICNQYSDESNIYKYKQLLESIVV